MNNKTKIKTILTMLLLAITMYAGAVQASSQPLRIGLTALNGTNINIGADSGLTVVKTGSMDNLTTTEPKAIELNASGKCIKINLDDRSTDAGRSLTIKTVDPADVLRVTSGKLTRKYKGALEVNAIAGAMKVINIVDLEDYLQGVLPAEMPDLFPKESLKAQAITARTYALSNLRYHSAEGFSLCDTTHCQKYLGAVSTYPKGAKAVQDTCGQVLVFDGKPASVFYSTDCGGATRDYTEVNPSYNAPYLCAITDPEDINHIIWQQAYRLSELEKKLIGAGIKEAEGLKELSIAKTGSTGWVMELSVTGKDASTTISADRLQKILGKTTVKSALFTIEMLTDNELLIKGKGSGHGIGMCQTGARALAMPPHNLTCAEILAHYFPGTQLSDCSILATAKMVMLPKTEDRRAVTNRNKKPVKSPELPKIPFDVRLHDPDSP